MPSYLTFSSFYKFEGFISLNNRDEENYQSKKEVLLKREGIETCVLSIVKQITGPDLIHETSAQGWCTRMTQRDGMGREVGGGFRMRNTCKSMADSYQCMAKTTTIL